MPAGTRASRTWRQARRSLPFVIGLAFLATVGANPTMSTGYGPVRQPGVAAHEWVSTDFAALTGAASRALTRGPVVDAPATARLAKFGDAWATAEPAKFTRAAKKFARAASSAPAVQATRTADAVPLTLQSVPGGPPTLRGAQPPAIRGQRAPPTPV